MNINPKLLKNVNEQLTLLNNKLNTKQDEGILLWTNPNPSLQFGNQTINFNDTYSHYDIISWVDGVTYEITRVYPNMRTIMQIMEGGFVRTRYATATSNSITFSDGMFFQSYSSGTQNNSQVIPYKIKG